MCGNMLTWAVLNELHSWVAARAIYTWESDDYFPRNSWDLPVHAIVCCTCLVPTSYIAGFPVSCSHSSSPM